MTQKNIKAFINDVLGLLRIRGFFTSIYTTFILQYTYGHFLSSTKWSAVDKNGDPIPWFSYPAIEYIEQFDLSNKIIFEYGAGNSTLFWGKRVKKVISVEDDKNWFDKIKKVFTLDNIKLLYYPEKKAYINSINKFTESFDIIVIDGSYRMECAKVAFPKLKKGGVIILDNADWMPNITKLLRSYGLIEIDMSGFGPINPYTSVTSFFIKRDFNFTPKLNQPVGGPGSVSNKYK